jgi:hypothetical protein
MARRGEVVNQVRERMTAAMLRDIGISERMAVPIVESVMKCFAGEQLYFPTMPREYPIEDIRASLEKGMAAAAVCRRFDLSRRQLNRLFPGGIPTSKRGAA